MGELNSRKPNRRSDYDYSSQGTYFVTFCVKEHCNVLWHEDALLKDTVGATVGRPPDSLLSDYGRIVKKCIELISVHYPTVIVYKYVVMPNHVHILISISDEICGRPMVAPTLSTVIQQLKGAITKQIGFSVWQKSFHDRIVRSDAEFRTLLEYIETNPYKFYEDLR